MENMAMRILNRLPLRISQGVIAAFFKINKFYALGFSRQFHSQPACWRVDNMRVRMLPALQDNYMYLLIDDQSGCAAVVDPVEPATVLSAVAEENVHLQAVLTTHHHWDHAGGNEKLVASHNQQQKEEGANSDHSLAVYGGDARIGGLTHTVGHGDTLTLGRLKVTCLLTPCHTSGHVCYHVTSADAEQNTTDPPASIVFTGDTLFHGGCGRFFEGTAEQMHHALNTVLSQLPDTTKVYCGHEYTVQNLSFGASVEPDNTDISERLQWALQQRANDATTVPSTIGLERKINPFMRVSEPSVRSYTKTLSDIETMAALRRAKDNFKGK